MHEWHRLIWASFALVWSRTDNAVCIMINKRKHSLWSGLCQFFNFRHTFDDGGCVTGWCQPQRLSQWVCKLQMKWICVLRAIKMQIILSCLLSVHVVPYGFAHKNPTIRKSLLPVTNVNEIERCIQTLNAIHFKPKPLPCAPKTTNRLIKRSIFFYTLTNDAFLLRYILFYSCKIASTVDTSHETYTITTMIFIRAKSNHVIAEISVHFTKKIRLRCIFIYVYELSWRFGLRWFCFNICGFLNESVIMTFEMITSCQKEEHREYTFIIQHIRNILC